MSDQTPLGLIDAMMIYAERPTKATARALSRITAAYRARNPIPEALYGLIMDDVAATLLPNSRLPAATTLSGEVHSDKETHVH